MLDSPRVLILGTPLRTFLEQAHELAKGHLHHNGRTEKLDLGQPVKAIAKREIAKECV